MMKSMLIIATLWLLLLCNAANAQLNSHFFAGGAFGIALLEDDGGDVNYDQYAAGKAFQVEAGYIIYLDPDAIAGFILQLGWKHSFHQPQDDFFSQRGRMSVGMFCYDIGFTIPFGKEKASYFAMTVGLNDSYHNYKNADLKISGLGLSTDFVFAWAISPDLQLTTRTGVHLVEARRLKYPDLGGYEELDSGGSVFRFEVGARYEF